MGVAKREKERQDDLLQLGLALCVDLKVLEECADHSDTYFEGSVDLEDGYRIANARWTQELITGFRTRREMTDSIKEAAEYFVSDECVRCKKLRED